SKKADILNINTFLPNSYITRRAFMLDTAGWLWTGTNKGFFKIEVDRLLRLEFQGSLLWLVFRF
ncbi:MAG TPA: hypothetical protein VGD17_01625, partial [Chitinophagaceae bacterium]